MFQLRGGLLVDGTGAPAQAVDVVVSGDRVRLLEPGIAIPDGVTEVIDCSGRVVAPGFVDIHCHSDLSGLEYPDAESRISQGVTTEVLGNCGMTPAPTGGDAEGLRGVIGTIDPGTSLDWDWSDLRSWRRRLESSPRKTDVASLLGHGSARFAVAGTQADVLTPPQLSALEDVVDQALDLGYVGVSLGLMYAPGESADHDELVAVARRVAARDAVLSVHMRDYGEALGKAVEEVVSVAEAAGCRLQISHLRAVSYVRGFADVVEFLDRKRATVDVAADAYPYTAGHTNLIQLFPAEIRALGAVAITGLLRSDPEAYARRLAASGTEPAKIILMKAASAPELVGKHGDELGPAPWRTMIDLLVDNACIVDVAVEGSFAEDLDVTFSTPWIYVASDGMALDATHTASVAHPRSFGAFPRAFRQMSALGRPIEEAIHRMTSGPASRMGLSAELVDGGPANLVVFDADSLTDTATYRSPMLPAQGVDLVAVNGVIVRRGGIAESPRPGRFRPRGQ